MKYCPNCSAEYRDDCETCADCQAPLIDKPDAPEAEAAPEQEQTENTLPPVLLTTVPGDAAADATEALLASCGIPVVRKYREGGDYLRASTGFTAFGVDLYVPAQALSDARAVLSSAPGPALSESEQRDMQSSESAYRKKRSTAAWIALILGYSGVLVLAANALYLLWRQIAR